MDNRIAKLPKWAQDHIISLERELCISKEKLLAAGWTMEVPANAEAVIDDVLGNLRFQQLPMSGRRIFFPGTGVEVSLNSSHNGFLYVSADAIAVRPMASNVVLIHGNHFPTNTRMVTR